MPRMNTTFLVSSKRSRPLFGGTCRVSEPEFVEPSVNAYKAHRIVPPQTCPSDERILYGSFATFDTEGKIILVNI